jgi:hypothetical protein
MPAQGLKHACTGTETSLQRDLKHVCTGTETCLHVDWNMTAQGPETCLHRDWNVPAQGPETCLHRDCFTLSLFVFFIYFEKFFLKFVWHIAVFSSIRVWKLCTSQWQNPPFLLCPLFNFLRSRRFGSRFCFPLQATKAPTLVIPLYRGCFPCLKMKTKLASEMSWFIKNCRWTNFRTKNIAVWLQTS